MMRVVKGRVSSSFGGRRDAVDGVHRIHQGVDIATAIGTKVYSPCDGVISSVYSHLSSGLTVVIRSECGKMRFAMCHLDSVDVEAGCSVERGELIARSGNSGRSMGAHLHFSVKAGGKWYAEQYIGGGFVDPMPYLEFEA